MRRGEILALRWKNVDFGKMTVRVVESLEQVKQTIRFKAPKTEKSRAVILPEYAINELKAWKEKQAQELLELGVIPSDDAFVCGRWDGGPVKPDSLTGEFRRAIKKIPNIPSIRFHDLRHSHATQLLAQGIHPKIAQERLGHSSIKTTLDLYSHVTDTMQDEAAERLDSAFKSVIKAKPNLTPKLG
jgi:integrase